MANTEEYIDTYLENKSSKQESPKPVFVLKDVRLFMNTLTRGMNMMQQSGIKAHYGRDETDEEIILTIKIPKTGK